MGGIALLRQGWQKLSNTCFNQFFAHSCSFFWQFSLVLLSPDFALSDIHLKPQGCYSGHMRHGTHSGHIWHTCHDYLLIVLWQPRDRSVTAAMGRVQQQSLHHHHRHPSRIITGIQSNVCLAMKLRFHLCSLCAVHSSSEARRCGCSE